MEKQLHYITNMQVEQASLNTQHLLQEHTMLQKGNLIEPSLCYVCQSESMLVNLCTALARLAC